MHSADKDRKNPRRRISCRSLRHKPTPSPLSEETNHPKTPATNSDKNKITDQRTKDGNEFSISIIGR